MTKPLGIILILAVLYGCGKVSTAEPNQDFEHLVGNFESGTLSGFSCLVVDTAVNTKIVTQPVRKGTYALQNSLRPNDYTNNGYRSEIAAYNCAKYRTEVFYAFSFMIDASYSDTSFNLICQWQDLPNYDQGEDWDPLPNVRGSSPPLALVYVGNTLQVKMNQNPRSNSQVFLVGEPLPISKGQWYDVVAHIYWSDNNLAYTEISVNGTYLTPYNGTDYKYYSANLFTRAGNYVKFGQYRGENNPLQTSVIYFDEIKIGSTYSEVAP